MGFGGREGVGEKMSRVANRQVLAFGGVKV